MSVKTLKAIRTVFLIMMVGGLGAFVATMLGWGEDGSAIPFISLLVGILSFSGFAFTMQRIQSISGSSDPAAQDNADAEVETSIEADSPNLDENPLADFDDKVRRAVDLERGGILIFAGLAICFFVKPEWLTPNVLLISLVIGAGNTVVGWIIQIVLGRKFNNKALVKRQFRKAAASVVFVIGAMGILAAQNQYAEFDFAYRLGASAGGLAGLIFLFRRIAGPALVIENADGADRE